jgi:hypothetical protein
MKPPEYSSMHKKVFAGKAGENCWGVSVDKLGEVGYIPVDDDRFEGSKWDSGEVGVGNYMGGIEGVWPDPRKGDIFYLIDLLLKKAERNHGESGDE